tara:strand:- start:1038 stop:2030 length:993 start_codon:yes stop_codon:yes gene_type:complete
MNQNNLKEQVLQNDHGDRVTLLNFGARLAGIELQLPEGSRNVICGYKNNKDYLDDQYFMGATVGRTCNRIADARFKIDGTEYLLNANEGKNNLHGGSGGFHNRYWAIDETTPEDTCRFVLQSKDGDQGYPGTLDASINYRWTNERELVLVVEAETDKPTHVNMTNHAYFNLSSSGDVLDHRLHVASQQILEVNEELLPTGNLMDISKTALDLQKSTLMRDIVTSKNSLIVRTGGIDFNYVLSNSDIHAELESSNGDLCMRIKTSCPGLQIYGGQKLGTPFSPYDGMCLEPQHFPDTPNIQSFPSTLLMPGERYSQTTSYRFISDRWKLLA